jgi:universal stress protein A
VDVERRGGANVDPIPRGALLVPIDMSKASLPAAVYATRLAQRMDTPIVLLHVVPPRQIEEGVTEGRYVDIQLGDIRSTVLWWFRTYVPPEARGDINVAAMTLVGHPEQEILIAARAIEAQMIVMATHGRTGLTRAVLGSVAEAVLRHAPCPVLAIPPAARTHTVMPDLNAFPDGQHTTAAGAAHPW